MTADSLADLLLLNAGQLCTIPPHNGGPQRGRALGALGLIAGGALAVKDGLLVDVGPTRRIESRWRADTILDARGRLVTPGLVDPHTHLIWAGNRAEEFERRIAGTTYQQIMAEGGGILHTMRATRSAGPDALAEKATVRLNTALAHGTTTLEIKTGYGLTPGAESAMLEAIALLSTRHPVRLVPTFLGAHAVPPEYQDDPNAYVEQIIAEMLPAAAAWKTRRWPGDLFCDVFCEDGAFTLEQTGRILQAARAAGFKIKIHVDEFKALGGTTLGVELGAVSLDHLDATPDEEIALLGRSNTVAVLLPLVPFNLGLTRFPPAQKFLDAGAIVALATDCNPGTAWCENLQMAMAVAERYLRLTPGQALAACTLNAAYAVGLGDRVGSLQVGRTADVVIWDTDDYRELGYHFGVNLAQTVVIGGQVVFAATS